MYRIYLKKMFKNGTKFSGCLKRSVMLCKPQQPHRYRTLCWSVNRTSDEFVLPACDRQKLALRNMTSFMQQPQTASWTSKTFVGILKLWLLSGRSLMTKAVRSSTIWDSWKKNLASAVYLWRYISFCVPHLDTVREVNLSD